MWVAIQLDEACVIIASHSLRALQSSVNTINTTAEVSSREMHMDHQRKQLSSSHHVNRSCFILGATLRRVEPGRGTLGRRGEDCTKTQHCHDLRCQHSATGDDNEVYASEQVL